MTRSNKSRDKWMGVRIFSLAFKRDYNKSLGHSSTTAICFYLIQRGEGGEKQVWKREGYGSHTRQIQRVNYRHDYQQTKRRWNVSYNIKRKEGPPPSCTLLFFSAGNWNETEWLNILKKSGERSISLKRAARERKKGVQTCLVWCSTVLFLVSQVMAACNKKKKKNREE